MIKKLFILLALAFCLDGKAQCSVNIVPVGSYTICAGQQTVTFTASGATNYTWMPGGIYTPTIVVSPNVTTIYTVTGTTGTCTASNTTTVVANPLPMPVATSNTPCANQANLSLACTPNGMVNYSWVGPNSYTSAIQNPVISYPSVTADGAYTVTVTDANACTNSVTVNVIINPLPVVDVTGDTVCVGQTINLTATGGVAYSWQNGGGTFTSNLQNPSIPNAQINMSGNYIVTVTDANGCVNGNVAQVVVNPLPDNSVTPSGVYNSTLTANATPAIYQWIYCGGGTACCGATNNQTFMGGGTFTYAVIITQNNCTDTSACYTSGFEGITTYANNNEQVSIYPNPSNGLFNLSISQFDNGKTNSIEVYNTTGACVHRQIVSSSNCQIDLSSLNEGVYNISLQSNEGVVNKRVVIVR